MTVSWMFIAHPNNFMTYLCLCSVPLHGQVGGMVNWLSMISGCCLSAFWGMTVAFDHQLNDMRRSSQLSMVVASGQMFLVQSNILQMQRVLNNKQHMTILGAFFLFHAARFTVVKQRREIEWDETKDKLATEQPQAVEECKTLSKK